MQIIQHIISEIKRGENIDLYVLLFASIPLAILSLLDITSNESIGPLTLGVLALIAVSLLSTRHEMQRLQLKSEELIHNIRLQSNELDEVQFLDEFPSSLKHDIAVCKEIYIIGVNLYRTVLEYFPLFADRLKNNEIKLKVLIMDPHGQTIATSLLRSSRPINEEVARSDIKQSLSNFCNLREIAPSNVEIKVIDYPLAFGGYLIKDENGQSILYMESYCYKMHVYDQPKVVLRPFNVKWYAFHKKQFEAIWEDANPWGC